MKPTPDQTQGRRKPLDRTSRRGRRTSGALPIDPPATIDAWLSVLRRVLRLPEAQRTAICAELDEHLRERVRDLTLAGAPEPDAIRQALEELGDIADFAHRLDRANRSSRRRLLMNSALIGTGALALTAAALTLRPSPAPSISTAVFEGAFGAISSADSKLDGRTLGDVDLTDTKLEVALEFVGENADIPVVPDWHALGEYGIDRDATLSLHLINAGVPEALDVLAQRISFNSGATVVWRETPHGIVVAPQEIVDERETTLVSYGIASVLHEMVDQYGVTHDEAANEITELLHSMVEPDLWDDNGGDRARLRIVNGRMFITAPPRVHERVDWILSELSEGGASSLGLPWQRNTHTMAFETGDTVTIQVQELFDVGEWFSITRVLRADGMVDVPALGSFRAAGLTPSQVHELVADAAGKIVKNPQVIVLRGSEQTSFSSSETKALLEAQSRIAALEAIVSDLKSGQSRRGGDTLPGSPPAGAHAGPDTVWQRSALDPRTMTVTGD